MFNTVNRQVPQYISEKFAHTNSIHNLWGSQHNLFVPRPYTEAFKKSFWYNVGVLSYGIVTVGRGCAGHWFK